MARILLAAALGTIALVALVGSPAAVGSSPAITVTPTQPIPGEVVTVHGAGFCPAPCSAVTVSVDGSVATGAVTVSSDGTFEVKVGLTPVAGTSTIVATQTDAGGGTLEASAIVHVVASDQSIAPGSVPPSATPTPPASASPPASGSPTPPVPSPTASPTPTISPNPTASAPASVEPSGTPVPSQPPAGSDSGPPWALLALIGLIGLIALATGATALWLRRRRSTGGTGQG